MIASLNTAIYLREREISQLTQRLAEARDQQASFYFPIYLVKHTSFSSPSPFYVHTDHQSLLTSHS